MLHFNPHCKTSWALTSAVGLVVIAMVALFCSRCSTTGRLCRLGYSREQATTMLARLPDSVTQRLIDQQMHNDTIALLVNQRYFIATHLDAYLAYLDTTRVSLTDAVAIVNVGAHHRWYADAVATDTSQRHLMLVNKLHYLDKHYVPDSLIKFRPTMAYANTLALRPVVENYISMQQAVKELFGAQLMVNSAYRSYDHQQQKHRAYGERICCRAGYSEHQTGLSIDITSLQHPDGVTFGEAPEGAWIKEHAHHYGFVLRYPPGKSRITGLDNEPWHLRWVGEQVATQIYNLGITFDEYYAYYIEQRVNSGQRPQ